MQENELRFRQVHLDFHTSEHIANIGAEFDPDEFAATLEKARVNSITCFAMCHHGWMYYDTKKFPEYKHPHLKRNLLKEQIEACHKRNIRVPIYTTVQWNKLPGDRHPEWCRMSENGSFVDYSPYEPGFYRGLCLNSPFADFIKDHVEDIFNSVPVDGLFFDAVGPQDCSCRYCREGMEAEGLDPADPEVRWQYGVKISDRFKQEVSELIRRHDKNATIFYNVGHIGPSIRSTMDTYSHLELESLPSGGWGYLHYPATMRYTRNLGIECMGMTGKFHTAWGDFHSFKNQAALEYECFNMLALGAKCSIGDQLHPSGKICPVTYDLIGSVYSQVEQKEPWCSGAEHVTEIGVLTPEEFMDKSHTQLHPAIFGAVQMLQESSYQFDIIDSQCDFEKYKVLILPDEIPLDEKLATKIEKYIRSGGALIATNKSGLNPEGTGFANDSFGLKLIGDAPFSPDFVRPGDKISNGLPQVEHVMYEKGMQVEALADSEILADVVVPYFNRTYQHFCSHRHTPSSGEVKYPAIIQNGSVIYFAHPIFTQYRKNAPLWCKKMLLNALELLLPEPLVRVNTPSTARIALNKQTKEGRYVLHLLHYMPERRSEEIDIIEEAIPLFNIEISVKTEKAIKSITCVPQNEELDYEVNDGRVEFTLPKLDGHQMVSLNYS